MQQLNVVISGFDHYDGVDVNPSLEVPHALAARGVDGLDGVELSIHAASLPVSFAEAWPTLLDVIERVRPHIVIATGLKHTARGIMLERCATNLMQAREPETDGAPTRPTPIDPNGPAAYWTRLPLRSILADFTRDSIPATLSSDAGTFVCNSLFYNLLNWASGQDRATVGFMSLPLVNEAPHPQRGLPLEQMTRAGEDVVREAVRYYLRPSSGDILIA